MDTSLVVIAICWNEVEIIPFFVRHYRSFCRKIIVYDNGSTDGSDILLSKLGCEVRKFGNGELDDREYLRIKNEEWKKQDADYVIVCDMDELLYHSNPKDYLRKSKEAGVTIFETQGIDMYSEEMPSLGKPIYSSVNKGLESSAYSKRIIFSPHIENINYDYGCHKSNPSGNLIWDKSKELKVLHFRNIGGANRLVKRHESYKKRMCAYNLKHGLGKHYLRNDKQIINDFNKYLSLSVPQL